jgi:hypothetical protein
MRKSRKEYPGKRKYQSWQLKSLIQIIERDLKALNECPNTLLSDDERRRIVRADEMFDEISLRLD